MRARSLFLLAIFALFYCFTASTQATSGGQSLGFNTANIDKSVSPCEDFYQFACGNWLKTAQIPPDQTEWASFVELYERNLATLRGILEKASAASASRNAIDQKIGDFYASCVDVKTVDERGSTPLKPELERVAAVRDRAGLMEAIAHAQLIGPNPLFNFSSASDLHNADMVIVHVDQGGLSLPDRDYYVKDDPQMKAMRDRLVAYATSMFRLVGQSPDEAAKSAQAVLRIETALAKASMDRTARRDPKTQDHKMTRQQLAALAPGFQFERYFAAMGTPAFTDLNVANPDFFQQVNAVLDAEPLDAWKTYVSWQLMDWSAPFLSQQFVEARFKMQQALTGQEVIPDRWKRCVNRTDQLLGEALGQRYVELTFGADGKARMLKMVDALEKSLDQDIGSLAWMGPETKKQAKIKLDAIRNKIGYPDKWRDYSSVRIARDDLLGNVIRATEFESRREIAKVGKPVDRTEWGMTPPTVDAYYNGSYNEIVFPAGILQPPFFDKSMDDAINFGGIGAVIGHELTHGFDDEGRKFDPKGNLRDWWTEEDGKEFEKRAGCIADEYSGFTAVDDLKLNGKLTLGENTADNGGARIALLALENQLAQDKSGKSSEKIDGYTPEQRFFLGMARVWCEKRRPEFARMLVSVDPHSPGRYRIDGVVQNMPEFQQAWGCKAGQPMVRRNACRVW